MLLRLQSDITEGPVSGLWNFVSFHVAQGPAELYGQGDSFNWPHQNLAKSRMKLDTPNFSKCQTLKLDAPNFSKYQNSFFTNVLTLGEIRSIEF